MSCISKIGLAFLIASFVSCIVAAPVFGYAPVNSHGEVGSSPNVDHAPGSAQENTYPGIGAWLSRFAGGSSGELPSEGSKGTGEKVKRIFDDSSVKSELDSEQKLGTVRAHTDENFASSNSKKSGDETEKAVKDESEVDEVMGVDVMKNSGDKHGADEDDLMDYDGHDADEVEDEDEDEEEDEDDEYEGERDEENTEEDEDVNGEEYYSVEDEDDDGEGLDNLTEEEIEALAEESELEDKENVDETAVEGESVDSGLPSY